MRALCEVLDLTNEGEAYIVMALVPGRFCGSRELRELRELRDENLRVVLKATDNVSASIVATPCLHHLIAIAQGNVENLHDF